MDEPIRPIIRALVGRTVNNVQPKVLWSEIGEVLDKPRGVRFSWEEAEEPHIPYPCLFINRVFCT